MKKVRKSSAAATGMSGFFSGKKQQEQKVAAPPSAASSAQEIRDVAASAPSGEPEPATERPMNLVVASSAAEPEPIEVTSHNMDHRRPSSRMLWMLSLWRGECGKRQTSRHEHVDTPYGV